MQNWGVEQWMKNAVRVQILGEAATGQSESLLWGGENVDFNEGFPPVPSVYGWNATVNLSCQNLSLVTAQTSCFHTQRAVFSGESHRFGSGG